MKIQLTFIYALITAATIMSCGEKELQSVCAAGVRKEFDDKILYATVENGCVVKYEKANEYKMNGDIMLKVYGDTTTTLPDKMIKLPKGMLITPHGEFVIKSTKDEVKIRLTKGKGKIKAGEKEVTLEHYKVLTLGGK
jgi:hypothetical protein